MMILGVTPVFGTGYIAVVLEALYSVFNGDPDAGSGTDADFLPFLATWVLPSFVTITLLVFSLTIGFALIRKLVFRLKMAVAWERHKRGVRSGRIRMDG